jgi:hypothetical protein
VLGVAPGIRCGGAFHSEQADAAAYVEVITDAYKAPPMYKKLRENVKSFYNIHWASVRDTMKSAESASKSAKRASWTAMRYIWPVSMRVPINLGHSDVARGVEMV